MRETTVKPMLGVVSNLPARRVRCYLVLPESWASVSIPARRVGSLRSRSSAKESESLRKLLGVITLLAVSFAGGATANGPAGAWVRKLLQSKRIESLHLGSMFNSRESAPDDASARATIQQTTAMADAIPSAPMPLLDSSNDLTPPEPRSARPAESNNKPRPKGIPNRRPERNDSPLPLAPPADSGSSSNSEKAAAGEPAAERPPEPLRPEGQLIPAEQPEPDHQRPPVDRHDSAFKLAALANPAESTRSPESPRPRADEPDAWKQLHERMLKLHVNRYTIEGALDGTVRFRCVVPLAGTTAVGRVFEAEASDPIQAATSALKRVALWQATERAE